MSQKPAEFQLYLFGRTFGNLITDENDRAGVFMYALMKGLLYFQPTSRSKEEVKFQEVKAGYSGLERAVEVCHASRGESDPGYTLLSEFKAIVDPVLHARFESSDINLGRSLLLQSLVQELAQRPKSYEDKLRRKGLELMEQIHTQGLVLGKREWLLADYALLEMYVGGHSI